MSAAPNGLLCKVDTAVTPINTSTEIFGALRLAAAQFGTLSTQRVFTATDAGPFTAYLVCYSTIGGGDPMFAPILSLVFVPGAQSNVEESADAASASSEGF